MSTRPALAAAANPRPLPPLAQRVPPAARRLGAVLRAGALERERERAQLGADTGVGFPLVAGGAMAGKIMWDYLNMPNDVFGRTGVQRYKERALRNQGGDYLIDALNACVVSGYDGYFMPPEEANAILEELFSFNITDANDYIEHAERNNQTSGLLYLKLMCELHGYCPPMPGDPPSPAPPPRLRPRYSDERLQPAAAPPRLRPQSSRG